MVSRFKAATVVAAALSLAFVPVVAYATEFDEPAPSPVDDFSPTSIAPLTPADFGVSVPTGASVETFASPDGAIAIVVNERLDAVETARLAQQSADLAFGESLVARDEDSTSTISLVAAACTQSQSVTPPAVYTSGGVKYSRSTYRLGRTAACTGSLSWNGSLWATKGYYQQIKQKAASTPPGITTQITLMSACTGTSNTYWGANVSWAGGLLISEDSHINCKA